MASSRPYRVTAVPPVGKTVAAEDHLVTSIEIPPILPAHQTAGLVRTVLAGRKFQDDGAGNMVRERDGVKVMISDDRNGGMQVTISSEASEDVPLPPPPPPSPCSCRAQASVRAAELASEEAARALQQKVTERLEGAASRLGCELEGVANKVTKEALKIKAAQCGQIKAISEDPQSGSMTIVVEV